MRSVVILLLAMTLMLSGCMKVGPDFTTPPAPVAESWMGPDDQQLTDREAHEEWWTVFNDPILDQLIEEARAAL